MSIHVEIWSDVMCPFCYIGKRKFEAALAQFPERDRVRVVWRSFQLSPELKSEPGQNIHQYLSKHKGIPLEEAERLNDYVTEMAAEVGLTYRFDKAVVANSFHAHRFAHFAKQHGKQNEAEERLFRAYFTEGENLDDYPTLIQLGAEIGLDTDALKAALENGTFTDEVREDIYEAFQFGIRSVPFFVFDRKYAVAGAQDSQVFLQTLEETFAEWKNENSGAAVEAGKA